jgi:hypothetical protein
MSDTQAERTTSGQAHPTGYHGERAATQPSGWVGWVIFAGVVMITLGAFHIIDGLVALFEKSYYLVTSSSLVVHVNYAAWGWVHLALGALFIIVGLGVLAGQLWAQVIGITLAVISAIINLAFIAAYPVWGVILIALDIVIIYALAMHGRELSAR